MSSALENGDYIHTIQLTTLDSVNASDVIMENYDGSYTRYVSGLSNGNLYVFKITGSSLESVTSEEIESILKTANIA